MNAVDRWIQRWRVSKVRRPIGPRDRVLDIGCEDGAMFRILRNYGEGIGIDPFIEAPLDAGRYRLVKGWFPQDLPDDRPFDVITMLAVLEHIPTDQQEALAGHCFERLKPGGKLLVTVPSPKVDTILAMLRAVRIVDADSLHQHYGFDPSRTVRLFTGAGLKLVESRRFQLGLNNFFRFEKPLHADGI
jgi:2-polyprenyl-3-methyl-5-hydroxy-6-metoxy-1,4-benzoquinol methylase